MRKRRVFISIGVAVLIALVLGAPLALRQYLLKQKAITTALWSFASGDSTVRQNGISELATFGVSAHRALSIAFRGKSTVLDRTYDLAGRKLPPSFAAYFPARPSRAQLRRAVAVNLYELGPSASRALLDEIESGLQEFDDYEGMTLLRAVYWSIPESARAAQILSNYLAHPRPGKLLFGMTDAREIWPNVPHLAPLLTPWLDLLDSTKEAAEGLGLMGTNAYSAIPRLVELARTGLISDTRLYSRFYGGNAQQLQPRLPLANRAAAIAALGRIGFVTPETIDVLKAAFVDESDLIRRDAALAFAAWGNKAAPALEYLIANLDRQNSTILQYQLYAFSEMGSAAAPAVPGLLDLSHNPQFSILQSFRSFPTSSPMSQYGFGPLLWQNEPRPGMIAAALALTRIDLAAAKERLDVLALALHSNVPVDVLQRIRSFKAELIPALEPDLHLDEPLGGLRGPFGPCGPPIRRIVLASNILALDEKNDAGRRLLHAAMKASDPTMRCLAAKWFYTATGDFEESLRIVAEGLNHVKSSEDQTIISAAGQFSVHARPLVPRIESFLDHPDQSDSLCRWKSASVDQRGAQIPAQWEERDKSEERER